MILRTLKIALTLLSLVSTAAAQRVERTEFAPYLLRKEADTATHTDTLSYVEFKPQAVASSFGEITREQLLEVPQSWVDASVFIHLEGLNSGYTLAINGREAIVCEDSYTPTDYNISPYLGVGTNLLSITTHSSSLGALEQGVAEPSRSPLEGSYIFAQNRLRIFDYSLTLVEHEDKKGGQLFMDVIVENNFNYPETIEVGFDVYDPAGKLVDFSTSKATLEGGARDTIRFAPHLYGATKFGSKGGSEPLYSVMLFTKRNRISSDHIPFKVAYKITDYDNGEFSANHKPVTLKATRYSTTHDKKQSEQEMRALKAKGFNTLRPDYPQPIWFYELCDKLGLYVVEQAAINAPTEAGNKRVGGTPSNDPKLVNTYLERVKAMYYRTRNFSCIVAYSLGGDSGNGYNMYKAYEWLKSVEKRRPVIYDGAAGEWNSDQLTIQN